MFTKKTSDGEMAKGMEPDKAKGMFMKKKKAKKTKKPLTPEQQNVFKKMGVKPN